MINSIRKQSRHNALFLFFITLAAGSSTKPAQATVVVCDASLHEKCGKEIGEILATCVFGNDNKTFLEYIDCLDQYIIDYKAHLDQNVTKNIEKILADMRLYVTGQHALNRTPSGIKIGGFLDQLKKALPKEVLCHIEKTLEDVCMVRSGAKISLMGLLSNLNKRLAKK